MSVEQIRKRNENRHRVLLHLQLYGSAKRVELSKQLGIRKSSITSIVSELLEIGILEESNPNKVRSPLSLCSTKFFARCAKVQPGSIVTAKVTLEGVIEERQKITLSPDAEPRDILKIIAEAFQSSMIHEVNKTVGLGISIPGTINSESGICIHSANMNRWRDIPAQAYFARALNLPVGILSQAICELQGNMWFNQQRNHLGNVLYLGLHDADIQSSLIINHKPHEGHHFTAGSIGLKKTTNSKNPALSQIQCSAEALWESVCRQRPELSVKSAFELSQEAQRDPTIFQILHEELEPLAAKLAVLLEYLDPDAIVVGTSDPGLSKIIVHSFKMHLKDLIPGRPSLESAFHVGDVCEDACLQGIAANLFASAFSSGNFEIKEIKS